MRHPVLDRPRRSLLAATVAALGLSLALVAGSALAADEAVQIVDFGFNPGTVTITAGDTVTWTNSDPVGHTATGDGWDTGDIPQGASAAITFNTAGTYSYICTPHPTMTGTVVVQAASGGGGGGGGGGAPTVPPTDAAAASPTGVAAFDGRAAAAGALLFGSLLAATFLIGRRRHAAEG